MLGTVYIQSPFSASRVEGSGRKVVTLRMGQEEQAFGPERPRAGVQDPYSKDKETVLVKARRPDSTLKLLNEWMRSSRLWRYYPSPIASDASADTAREPAPVLESRGVQNSRWESSPLNNNPTCMARPNSHGRFILPS